VDNESVLVGGYKKIKKNTKRGGLGGGGGGILKGVRLLGVFLAQEKNSVGLRLGQWGTRNHRDEKKKVEEKKDELCKVRWGINQKGKLVKLPKSERGGDAR